MSKGEIRDLLSSLLPYIEGQKQATALFTIVLMLKMTHAEFDIPHLHVEPISIQPTTISMIAASGATPTSMTIGQIS
jgi:hypothetical protein